MNASSMPEMASTSCTDLSHYPHIFASSSISLISYLPDNHQSCLVFLPQVDIMQMCVVELVDRPGKPLFHLEHHIEGEYVKYNSNSGFVRDENLRSTPQAFSHFTFERWVLTGSDVKESRNVIF